MSQEADELSTDDRASGQEDATTQKRQRGTINFPYTDLDDAVKVARAVFLKGGQSASLDQVAAELEHKNVTSGGFRSKVNAARLFGFLKTSGMTVRLESLGLRVVDPKSEPAARADAFLRVPLFKSIFEKYRGSLLPGADALEAEMVNFGVAPGQKDRARQVFLRSAQQAGYFQSGTDRLVPPSFGQPDKLLKANEPEKLSNPRGAKSLRDHPLIQGLFEMLPEQGPWPEEALTEWLDAAKVNFKLVYGKPLSSATSEPQPPVERSENDPQGSTERSD